MKVICPVCERVIGAYIPKGGDGSAYRPRRHGECEGRFELVEEIYEEAHLTQRAADVSACPRCKEVGLRIVDTCVGCGFDYSKRR